MGTAATQIRKAYQKILDTIPFPVLVMDSEAQIKLYNHATRPLLAPRPDEVFQRRFGEALHCIHADGGCGEGEDCRGCPVRDAISLAARGLRVVRRKAKMQFSGKESVHLAHLLVTASPLEFEDGCLLLVMLEDITELTVLREITPICSHCKSVRNEEEKWVKVEEYFAENANTEFSHGLCPECVKSLYPEYDNDDGR